MNEKLQTKERKKETRKMRDKGNPPNMTPHNLESLENYNNSMSYKKKLFLSG